MGFANRLKDPIHTIFINKLCFVRWFIEFLSTFVRIWYSLIINFNMKKSSISILLVISGIIFILLGCKKDKEVTDRCPELSAAIDDAVTAFTSNPSEATCNAYKTTIHDFYDGCTLITPAQRASLDAALESLDCSQF